MSTMPPVCQISNYLGPLPTLTVIGPAHSSTICCIIYTGIFFGFWYFDAAVCSPNNIPFPNNKPGYIVWEYYILSFVFSSLVFFSLGFFVFLRSLFVFLKSFLR